MTFDKRLIDNGLVHEGYWRVRRVVLEHEAADGARLDEAMAMIEAGEIVDAKTIVLLQRLGAERAAG